MTPTYHLDHSTIVGYAAGTLEEAFTVVAAAHVALCPDCSRAVREAEAIGGEMLAALPVEEVSAGCRAQTLAALDQATLHRLPVASPRAELPIPLARLMGIQSFDSIPWKTKAPGVAMCDVKLPAAARGRLKLLRIASGRAMPEHGHGGEEITLVLKGAYNDHIGRFGPGDVADLDEDVEHRPIAEQGGECICLVAIERPTRFKSLAARLMQPFVGI